MVCSSQIHFNNCKQHSSLCHEVKEMVLSVTRPLRHAKIHTPETHSSLAINWESRSMHSWTCAGSSGSSPLVSSRESSFLRWKNSDAKRCTSCGAQRKHSCAYDVRRGISFLGPHSPPPLIFFQVAKKRARQIHM